MLFLCKELTFQTKGKKVEYFNVKTNIDKFIKESKLRDGILLVQTPHTTCSVIFEEMVHDFDENGNEYLQADLNAKLDKMFPEETVEKTEYLYPGPVHLALAQKKDKLYIDHPEFLYNGPAHMKASMFGASETFVVKDGNVLMGKFGAVYFVDWDYNRSRKRSCFLCLLGE